MPLFIFFFSLFDVCFSDWVISIVLLRVFDFSFVFFNSKISILFFLISSNSLLKLSVF